MDKPVKFGIWTVVCQAPYEKLGEKHARWVLACPMGHQRVLTGYAAQKLNTRQHASECPLCSGPGSDWVPGKVVGGFRLLERVGKRVESLRWKVQCTGKCAKVSTKLASDLAKNKRGCRVCGWVTYEAFGEKLTMQQLEEISGVNASTLSGRIFRGMSPEAAVLHRLNAHHQTPAQE